ncbi:MAG: DUF4270 family protein [Bacteroidia bacterium]
MKLNTSCFYHRILSRHFDGTKFFLIAAIVLLASCKKESSLGSDVQPEGDLINLQYTDTMSLFSFTVREDSLRSDESGAAQIGDMNDAYFGRTQAGLFTQIVIPGSLQNISFGGVLDSCALQLAYDSEFYGDTAQLQNFNVYQVTEDMDAASTYYSNQVKQCYPTFASRIPVGSRSLAPRPRTNTIVANDTLKPVLHIPINMNFAQQIFNQGGGPNLLNTTNFLQYMKGLYIASETPGLQHGEGSLLRFNLKDTSTKFTLYYHVGTESRTFSFVIGTTAAYFGHYTHDYSTAGPVSDLNNQLATGTNTTGEVYVQGVSGVKTKILFPYLADLQNLGYAIAINKAELVFKADASTSSGDDFPINKQLYVVSIDSADTQVLLPDIFESAGYFGGSANTTTNEYHINIARYFQQLMEGSKPNNGLYLKEFDPNGQSRRVVLGSANPTAPLKMYIHLVYTRIN